MRITRLLFMMLSLCGLVFLASCGDDDAPPPENEPEIITDAKLVFTPAGGGTAIEATAKDPDGEGPKDLEVTKQIVLSSNTTYTMTIELDNSLAEESISDEVKEEDDEHMFFFGWTNDLFSNPAGNGNIDARADAVNYNDQDENSLDVGLSTQWTTGSEATGTFRVVLKHQPNIKSATSTVNDGESDVDVEWNITIQ